jgi:hypothetical protein
MAFRAHLVLCGFLLLALGVALPARADSITITFTVFPAPGDPVNSAPSTGSFAFDTSLIPSGGGRVENVASGLGATTINFMWSHTLWTTANADLGELRFSRSGRLVDFFLGGFSGGLTGFLTGPPEAVVDDFAILSFQAAEGFGFQYTNAGNPEILFGGLTTDLHPTPEPSSILTGRRRWRTPAAKAPLS